MSIGNMERRFFSIVIPAHNEERYLENTLIHLKRQDYPAEKFETIIVENGSTDRTFAVAKKFEDAHTKVLQSDKGVSRARNAGIGQAAPDSDWILFLDADTVLESGFLKELDEYLARRTGYSVGTTSLRPLPDTSYARVWFWVHNVGHMLSKTSFTIHMVKRSLFPPLRYDERMVTAEDIHLIRQAQAYGKFFYLWTKNVATSTRRFEQLGWWYILFYWTFVAILPERWQRRFTYEEVR